VDIPCGTSVVHGRTKPALQLALSLRQACFYLRPFNPCKAHHVEIDIPVNEYYEYFGPDHKLDVKSSNVDDMNTGPYLERVKRIVMENLRQIGGPPSVQMQGIPSAMLSAIPD
jgi:hypothetical protein